VISERIRQNKTEGAAYATGTVAVPISQNGGPTSREEGVLVVEQSVDDDPGGAISLERMLEY
jgi:hypothetical protein